MKVWDATTGELQTTLRAEGATAYNVAWSPDGSRLAFGSGNRVEVWSKCP